MEEEEPEGEAVVGPSRETTAHSSGNTPPVPLIYPDINSYIYIILTYHYSSLTSFFSFFLADEYADEEGSRPQTKEEEDIDMLCSWIQVVDFPAWPEEEAPGLLLEESFLSFFSPPAVHMAFCSPYIFLPLYFCFPLSFRGWTCWKRLVPWGRRPAGWKLRLSAWRLRGWGKWKWQWQAQWWKVFMGFWGGQCHTHPYPQPHLPTRKLTIPHPPLSPICPLRTRSLQSCRPGNEVCLSSCPSSFRGGDSCQHAAPLHSVGGIKWVYRCQVEDCKEGPSTLQATICVHVCKVHLGVGLMYPSYSKSFFQPGHIPMLQKESC